MDLSAYDSSSNTFALTYWIKVAATGNGQGLYFVPAIAGCTGNRGDAYTYTNALLNQDTLATTDGWTQITISGLYTGMGVGDNKGIVDNEDGTYSLYFYYLCRSTVSTNTTATILMDEIKIVK